MRREPGKARSTELSLTVELTSPDLAHVTRIREALVKLALAHVRAREGGANETPRPSRNAA